MATDPYAAIRKLPVIHHGTADEQRAKLPAGYLDALAGSQELPQWQPQSEYALDLDALAQTPFQSKFNSLAQQSDGTLLATFQKPGGHKYELMTAA